MLGASLNLILDTTQYPDGEYSIIVDADNSAGLSSQKSIDVMIDN